MLRDEPLQGYLDNTMKIRTLLSAATGWLALSLSGPALSDISLTYQSTETPEYRSTILVGTDYIRFENPMAPDFFMLYDARRQMMTLVDGSSRSYTTLDRETLESLSEQIDVTRQAIIAELEAGIKNASPEEKAQMAEILEQITELSQAPQKDIVSYQPVQQHTTINGYPCQQIRALVNNQEQATLCVAKASKVGVPEDVMATLSSFHHFSNSVHQQLSPGDATELLFVMNSTDNLPVSIKRQFPSSAADEYHLTEVKELTIPGKSFQVPDNFESKDIEDAFIVD